MVGPAGKNAEIVVPGRRDPADAGDDQEDADEGVAGLSASSFEAAVVAGGVEGVAGEGQEENAEADADGGGDQTRHIRAFSIGDDRGRVDATEAISLGAVRLVLNPRLIFLADATVGLLIAVQAGARLRAKT